VRTNEVNAQFVVSDPPASALSSWKASPPPALAEYELVDESYNSLTFEKRWMEWYMKITYALSLGLFGRQGESIYRVTARFDDHEGGTRVTVVGMLDDDARAALGQWAAERGRIIQDWGLTGP
jgi:hypothetical protein